ncbi:MAG: helicase C-terminal domain-containing protein, partial [Chitinivibrionales bacterium]
GKACEIVVIPRLPFSVPTHPLTRALSDKAEQEYGNSFTGFSLPEAVIRFRQGAGRLIRSHRDKGVLLVLDKRIVEKSYGRVFMNSVKGEFAVIKEKNELNRLAGDFFGS